ncbi:hypothetical protein [Mycobacterium montefiorense]|uniref:hypothetical protein n=1 Tax=Mycobacterium montefiorense TaxID=154654 RepID=UPI0021DD0961|nr:hypothetical protein [Mycobacterium montefiorense]MCV7426133.1 hypothetical protein [Mycobacterium montefiorense]GLE54258.1 hypothetical protein ATCCBAA256_38310 [Mycobacterium montefiorense]
MLGSHRSSFLYSESDTDAGAITPAAETGPPTLALLGVPLGLPGHLYYAGLGALALVGVVEWPIAATWSRWIRNHPISESNPFWCNSCRDRRDGPHRLTL